MSKKNKISIYKIKDDYSTNFLKFNSFSYVDFGKNGQLYYTNSIESKPTWEQSSFKMDLGVFKLSNSRAVLIVNSSTKHLYAITFGQGLYMLKNSALVSDFGLKVALNNISEEEFRVLTKVSLANKHGISQEQLGELSNIYEFNFDVEQDLIKKVVAKPLKGKFGNITVSAGQGLNLSVDYNIDNILEFVDEVELMYDKEEYKKFFPWIDNYKIIKNKEDKDKLDEYLIEQININHSSIQLSIPEIIEWDNFSYFKMINSNNQKLYDIDIEDYIKCKNQEEINIKNLKKDKILLFNNDDNLWYKWPIYRCIIAEIKLNNIQYCLIDSEWYQISEDYYSKINDFYDNIQIEKNIKFPECDVQKEDDYNNKLSLSFKTSLELHKKMIKYNSTTSPVEVADVYYDNYFIHVKNGTSSSQLSHFWNQGYVSGRLLLEEAFRKELEKQVSAYFIESNATRLFRNNIQNFKANNNTIVFAILSKKAGERPNIPFFSKISFKKIYNELINCGYKVTQVSQFIFD